METKTVRALFERQVEAFTGSPEFAALEAGCGDYDAFIENVARAHLKSPQLVAFLYALAPPGRPATSSEISSRSSASKRSRSARTPRCWRICSGPPGSDTGWWRSRPGRRTTFDG